MQHNHIAVRRILIFQAIIIFVIISCSYASATISQQLLYNMDDTYVNASATGTNYDAQGLVVNSGGDGDCESWFRFNLSDPNGYYVLSSVLYAYAYSVTNSRTYSIYPATSATWTETTITWDNKPSYGSALTSYWPTAPQWAYWDITNDFKTNYNQGDSFAAYAITVGSSGNIYVEDKENSKATGNVPYLNLTIMTPQLYILSPADPTSTYNTSSTFQYNTTDTGNLTNCSLIFDGAINKTNNTISGNISSTFTLSNVFPGSHTWSIRCYDVNRYAYQMDSATRNLEILATVEWTDPSSATRLDLGSTTINSATITGTRQIYSNNSNNNARVTCSGDCTRITTNWTARNMAGSTTQTAGFNCSTSVAGSFTANYALLSDQDTSSDTLTVNCTIQAADLRISSTNITFSDNTPTENENVTVTAGIYNDGTYAASNVVVRFYENNYTGTQIGSDHTIDLNPGAYTTVQENWTARIGNFSIYAVVDPPIATNGSIAESDESNNYAYKDILINMWTIYIGNVTGKITLGSSTTLLISWSVTNITSSLVYVTDTDSSIDFNSLTALTRDTSGNYASNDVTELDSILNTTAYPDSLNSTFMSGANPKKTETFRIFGNTIANVPVINSTNSTTFETGMLWDASDDSNHNNQFDSTAQEDIVFVARVNQSKQGMYGKYDYEIRIPSRLKNYKGPDSRTVTFYSEIR